MNRMWKQLIGICVLVAVICLGVAAVWMSSRKDSAQDAAVSSDSVMDADGATAETGTNPSDKESKAGAVVSGDSEDAGIPDESTDNYIEGQLARECEKKYGTDTKAVFEFSLEDSEEMLDFDRINGLKTYIAKPSSSGEELVRKVSDFFWEGKDYTTNVKDAKKVQDEMLQTWGDSYTCIEEDSKDRIEGNSYGITYIAGNETRPIEEKEDYIKTLCDNLSFGLGDHTAYDWELRQEWEYGIKNYALKEQLNGIWINTKLSGDGMDADGVDYRSHNHFFYFEDDLLKSAETLYSAEIIREDEPKQTFQSIDELQAYIKDSLYREFDKGEGHEVYRLNRFYLFYARGITKEQEFVYSPWLICEGPTAVMWAQPDRYWDDSDGAVALNLNSGEVYDLGGAEDLLRNYTG